MFPTVSLAEAVSEVLDESQSPQIGSMFPTCVAFFFKDEKNRLRYGRNPLKSGQCFLPAIVDVVCDEEIPVAIPSNRVNVSYKENDGYRYNLYFAQSRNPLKSGQCFLLRNGMLRSPLYISSQSPQIGSMFPTAPIFFYAL